MSVLYFLEGMLRVGIVFLPLVLLLLIYPDLTKRDKTLDIGEKKIPIYDHLSPDSRHPNFARWVAVYLCCYFGLFFASFYKCGPDASVGEVIISLFMFSPVLVGDFLLGSFGLVEWGSGSASSCFQ